MTKTANVPGRICLLASVQVATTGRRSYDGRMQSAGDNMRRKFTRLSLWIASLILSLLASGDRQLEVHAQFAPPPVQPGTTRGIPDASGQVPGAQPTPQSAEMLAKLEKRRNEARQQDLIKDTNKLLTLATELKTDVDKTNKDMLSIDVIKKADEIEKLAKSVKERMRQ